MKNYTETEIISLIARFEKHILPKPEWTHEAHLVVAIYYMKKYLFSQAMPLVRTYITKHNESVGTVNSDTEGYHETITKFWLILAGLFLSENHFSSTENAVNAFINSDFGNSKLPLSYYTENTLFSVKARHHWIEPDLKEFPRLN